MNTAISPVERMDRRNILFCVAILAAAILIIWPFAEIGYGDDTAFARVALVLARTGHLLYNGWETNFLVSHAFWGALFIRLFGFSFVCLRLSTIPFALGAVGLCYLLMCRSGLQPRSAILVTLLFGLSPLFLPGAVSFMTDVPSVFLMFASLYSFARAFESPGGPKSYGWLVLGVATGFMGGTGRQVVWIVPLVVLPYLAWVRRHQKWLGMSAMVVWFLVLCGVIYTTRWFNHQPYAVITPSVFSYMKLVMKRPFPAMNMTARMGLTLVLVIFPAAVPLLLRASIDTWRGSRGRKIFVAALLLLVLTAIVIHPTLASIPWLPNTLNWEGIHGDDPLPGRPIVLVRPIRVLVSVVVYASLCVLAGEFLALRRLVRRAARLFLDSSGDRFTFAAMSLVSVSYIAVLVLRSVEFIFDRYLLPIMPWMAAVFLLWFEKDNPNAERVLRRSMPFAWVVLAILASYGIASTQDLWRLDEARVVATQELESTGVARTAIDGGFEYNFWTELMTNGRINSPWVVNPPGAYNPNVSLTPSVVPAYRLEYDVRPETAPSGFGSVPYFSLLPPFHKQVRIDRVLKH